MYKSEIGNKRHARLDSAFGSSRTPVSTGTPGSLGSSRTPGSTGSSGSRRSSGRTSGAIIRSIILAILSAAMLAASAGCALNPPAHSPQHTGAPDDGGNTGATDFDGTFGEALLTYLEQQTDGNYFVSPLSIEYALEMCVAGAEGKTLEGLLAALGAENAEQLVGRLDSAAAFEKEFERKVKEARAAYDSLDERERLYFKEPSWALRSANSAWLRDDLPGFTDNYMNRLAKFGAEHKRFSPASAAGSVNGWVNDKTEGFIQSVLPDNYNADNLAVILVNALYYKNAWTREFSQGVEGNFRTHDGKTVKKNFVSTVAEFDYYKDDVTELVVVPMENDVNMVFVKGSVEDLAGKLGKAKTTRVELEMPEFDIETCLNNNEIADFMKKRGAGEAFSPEKADFSVINGEKGIFIGDIIHKAKISLDRSGVEAAAVTVIGVPGSSQISQPDPVAVTLDEPFRFFITARGSAEEAGKDIILFAGRLSE